MVDLTIYPIFMDNQSTLKETSIDKRDQAEAKYMTESSKQVINFDQVKNDYARPLCLSSVPSSVDALFSDTEGHLVFVEFKNGVMSQKKQYDVLKKAYDSVLIFNDITSSQLAELRDSAEFVLVYNESENVDNSDGELKDKLAAQVQPSQAFDAIAKAISGLAKKEYICFGLRRLQNYCFKKVHTYTENEFQNYLMSH